MLLYGYHLQQSLADTIGYHTETPAQDQTVTINGVTVIQKKGETVKISDFNFFVSHWSLQ